MENELEVEKKQFDSENCRPVLLYLELILRIERFAKDLYCLGFQCCPQLKASVLMKCRVSKLVTILDFLKTCLPSYPRHSNEIMKLPPKAFLVITCTDPGRSFWDISPRTFLLAFCDNLLQKLRRTRL